MDRLYFRRAAPGFRAARGGLVQRVQRALAREGFSPGALDGIFGRDTENALIGWQRVTGRPDHGAVDAGTWRALVESAPPSRYERALQVTAAFEGHGFGLAAGNWDGAWLTWGVIGFTLRHGEVQAILRALLDESAPLVHDVFGPLMPELLAMLRGTPADQRAWAERISLPPDGYRIAAPWADAFQRLGDTPAAQHAQLVRAERYWQRALFDARDFRLTSELGLALCFDIAVQNGGVDSGDRRRAREQIGPRWPKSEAPVRIALAHAVADGSRPAYVEDVRSRKLTMATGTGWVHGARYRLADWGLIDDPPDF